MTAHPADVGGRVAVIIVNYNSGPLLARCLASVAAQTRPPARVILVDNASTDGSAEDLPGLPVECIRLAHNIGFAAANNIGIERAGDCGWVALLNPDAFPAPTWLQALLDAASASPEFTFFASQQRDAGDVTRLDGAGDEYTVAGLAWRRGHGRPVSADWTVAGEVFSPCAAAALYRRDAVAEVGGFDQTFFCYFEDVDLAFRLRLRGHRCLYVPDAVVDHVGSALTGRRSDFSAYHGHRNLVWTWVKNMPWPLLWIYLPHHLALTALSVAWLARRGQGALLLRAKWDALSGVPRAWRARRTTQRDRRVGAWQLRRQMVRGIRALGVGRFDDPPRS